ncbi:MAG: hypothetical protein Q8K82_17560 [Gemmatimonadaceae bacterium]|nr:hypothetical protein [Gemmatimonadaceae bacterium]
MKRLATCRLAAALIALSGCAEGPGVVDPADDRRKWNWDSPLATIGGGETLICWPLLVNFNDTLNCTFANSGILNFPTWSFEADGGLVNSGPLGGPISNANWSGPLVVSGDVVVRYVTNQGLIASQRQTVGVTRRSWSWASSVGGTQGALGAIDICFQAGWEGLTAARDCTSPVSARDFFTPRVVANGNGYTAAQVPGTGPNGGWWYVTNPTGDLDLRTQVRRDYRTDGTFFSVAAPAAVANGCAAAFPQAPTATRNMQTVNTSCVPTAAFTGLVNCIWTHEAAHLAAGTTAAQASANDVYRLWEPKVERSAADLQIAVSSEYTLAEDRVSIPLIAAHDPLTPYFFNIWYNSGSGWGAGTTARGVTC